MLSTSIISYVALSAPLFPALAFVGIAIAMLLGQPPEERFTARVVSVCFTVPVVATLTVALWLLAYDDAPILIPLGTWIESAGYAFDTSVLVDRLSAPMMVLTAILCGLIGRFSATYLHREPGQPRFYMLLSLFATGMFGLVMAGSLDLLIAGWELVGLSSMLLIGFFHERTFPVRNALRAFITYRVCDIGLLVGVVLMHHYLGTGDFAPAFGLDKWPSSAHAFEGIGPELIVLSLLLAAMGKSALFPVGSWLPRAMEGPTPSSAIFYGSLSVHAGAYLLLRTIPLIEQTTTAKVIIVLIGVFTALHGTLVARVQTDVKSQLAYATTTQVGVIFMEIGLGFPRIALLHLVSHACLRTVQMLRAPNVIHDTLMLRSLAGRDEAAAGSEAVPTGRLKLWWYHLSLERFHLDTFLERYVARPVLGMAQLAEAFEQRLLSTIARGTQDESDSPDPAVLGGARERRAP
jgi:NADH:ubiquinone oxidoreductase subunit 5 (subunit L)/multisubunit Na+/H+ antiporter MnhA subunit